MPDSDWVRYRQIRGKSLPERVVLLGVPYRLAKLLKRDFYAATGMFEREDPTPNDAHRRVLLKIYHTDSFCWLPLGWLGRWLARRETAFFQGLDGIEGIPRFLETFGPSGLVREYLPGENLRDYLAAGHIPDAAFFPRLRAILAEVHRRGVSHNDLSKPENVLAQPDGSPVLIDFQIALRQGSGLFGWLKRPLIRYMQSVDHFHLTKQHRRCRPGDFTAEEIAQARKKGVLLTLHAGIRIPYRAVRHLVLKNFLLKDENKKAA